MIDTAEASPSMARAAETVRPAEAKRAVTSVTAVRWLRRRLRAVRAALLALVTLVPDLAGSPPTLAALRTHLGTERVLVKLRELGRAHLSSLPPPLGLYARAGR